MIFRDRLLAETDSICCGFFQKRGVVIFHLGDSLQQAQAPDASRSHHKKCTPFRKSCGVRFSSKAKFEHMKTAAQRIETADTIELIPRMLHLKKILVPTDFSETSKKAVQYAVR